VCFNGLNTWEKAKKNGKLNHLLNFCYGELVVEEYSVIPINLTKYREVTAATTCYISENPTPFLQYCATV
jgi:hypothetical protein